MVGLESFVQGLQIDPISFVLLVVKIELSFEKNMVEFPFTLFHLDHSLHHLFHHQVMILKIMTTLATMIRPSLVQQQQRLHHFNNLHLQLLLRHHLLLLTIIIDESTTSHL